MAWITKCTDCGDRRPATEETRPEGRCPQCCCGTAILYWLPEPKVDVIYDESGLVVGTSRRSA